VELRTDLKAGSSMVVGIIYKKYSLCTCKYSITVMKQFDVHHLRQQTLSFTSHQVNMSISVIAARRYCFLVWMGVGG